MRFQNLVTRDRAEYIANKIIFSMSMSPHQINNGWCRLFAIKMIDQLEGAKLVLSNNLSGLFPGHCVVLYRGKYYDAEDPQGVSDPLELAYNNRMRAAQCGEQWALSSINAVAEYDPRSPYG